MMNDWNRREQEFQRRRRQVIRMNRFVTILTTVCVVGAVVGSIFLVKFIWQSDMPDWLKVLLITR